jgi:hypothetical protein
MTLQGPGSNAIDQSYRMGVINWTHDFKDEGPRPKSGKLRLNIPQHHFEGKMNLVWTNKKRTKKEIASWFEELKVQAKLKGKVQLKDSICFKWVQIGS